MTIQEFASKCNVQESTVKGWIEKGYIPGARDGFIPDSAREPYTDARAKKGYAIIKSILTACNNRYGVYAGLYNLSQPEFDAYIKSLLDSNRIVAYEDDGITYYNITADGANLLRNWNKKDVGSILQVIAIFMGIA